MDIWISLKQITVNQSPVKICQNWVPKHPKLWLARKHGYKTNKGEQFHVHWHPILTHSHMPADLLNTGPTIHQDKCHGSMRWSIIKSSSSASGK